MDSNFSGEGLAFQNNLIKEQYRQIEEQAA